MKPRVHCEPSFGCVESMLHLDGLFEDLEEAGGADQFQKILFAALEVGEMMGLPVPRDA